MRIPCRPTVPQRCLAVGCRAEDGETDLTKVMIAAQQAADVINSMDTLVSEALVRALPSLKTERVCV